MSKIYVYNLLFLLFLLVVTLLLAMTDLGAFHMPVAFFIASIKAILIGLFFMGLKYNDSMHKFFAISGLFFLFVLFSLSLADYLSRSWLSLPGQFPPPSASVSETS